MSERVLMLGATSGIAVALCDVMAARGCDLILAGRNVTRLEQQAAELRARHRVTVFVEPFEALDFDHHDAFFERCLAHFDGSLDIVVLCHAYLTDQQLTQTDFREARRTIDVTFTSAVSILGIAANYFERRRRGMIAAISSVAGERGRMSNYTYGASKAGLTVWLEGLRNRLCHAGVHVLTIKPGFVDTPMARGRVSPNSPLLATPRRVARAIDRAIRRRRDVLTTPWFWRPIMFLVRLTPEPIFKRLKL